MKDIEKKNISANEKGKEKSKNAFDNMKNALDNLKADIKEKHEEKKDEQIIDDLEKIIDTSESASKKPSSTPPSKETTDKIVKYQQQITARMVRHPERPPEVGEAALSVISTIATSDQDPNIIARSIGKIMKLILKL